jgi:hypothetical protein
MQRAESDEEMEQAVLFLSKNAKVGVLNTVAEREES